MEGRAVGALKGAWKGALRRAPFFSATRASAGTPPSSQQRALFAAVRALHRSITFVANTAFASAARSPHQRAFSQPPAYSSHARLPRAPLP